MMCRRVDSVFFSEAANFWITIQTYLGPQLNVLGGEAVIEYLPKKRFRASRPFIYYILSR